ncbi:MAG: hypothetical protein AAGA18_07995 [Verrucomicrobiota bacterium]
MVSQISAQVEETATWGGRGLTTNWEDAANWTTAAFPDNDSTIEYRVTIDGASNQGQQSVVTLTGSSGNIEINTLQLFSNVAIDPDTLIIDDNVNLTIEQDNAVGTTSFINNGGLIRVVSAGAFSQLIVRGGTVDLTGNGTIRLEDGTRARINGNGTSPILNNVSNTIEGYGLLGNNQLGLINGGVISANINGETLQVNASPNAMTNSNIMRASSGGILLINGTDITNLGSGGLQVFDNSLVNLDSSTLIDGTLISTGTGRFQIVDSSTIDGSTSGDVLIEAPIDVLNVQNLTLVGDIDNSNTIHVNGTGSLNQIVIEGTVTLKSNGNIVLSDDPNNRINSGGSTPVLNNLNNTISGAGIISNNNMGVINGSSALILVDGTNSLRLNPNSSDLKNAGIIRAIGSGGILFQGGDYFNFISGDEGLIEIIGSSLQLDGGADVSGGEMQIENASTLILNGGDYIDGNLDVDSSSSISVISSGCVLGGNVTLDGDTTINANAQLTLLSDGNYTNTATISLNATDTLLSQFICDDGPVSLSGGGVVTLSDSTRNRITGSGSSPSFTNMDHLIEGAGEYGLNQLTLENQGTIRAIYTTPLIINPDTGGMTNTGTMESMGSGAILRLSATDYFNDGGIIQAQTGSSVEFDQADIVSGTLQTFGTGKLIVPSGTFEWDGGPGATLAGNLVVENAAVLNLNGSFNIGSSLIEVKSSGGSTTISIDGTSTLTGNGTIQFSDFINNRINSGSGAVRFINDGNTIQGSLEIGLNNMGFTNNALVNATGTEGIIIDTNGNGLVNSGTFRSSNPSGLLRIRTPVTFDNTGGIIEALDGCTVELQAADISAGTLQTTGTGQIVVTDSLTITNTGSTTLNGNFSVNNNEALTLFGDFTVGSSNFKLNGNSNATFLIIPGDHTITGTGIIDMGDNGSGRINEPVTGAVGGEVLTINDMTIIGSGLLGNDNIDFINNGTVRATSETSTLEINVPGTDWWDNPALGTLIAEGAAGMHIRQKFRNTGTVQINSGSQFVVDGEYGQLGNGTTVVNGTLTPSGDMNIASPSTLSGSGILNSDVNLQGTLSPGNSIGSITIATGNQLFLDSGSELFIEIASKSDFDSLETVASSILAGGATVTVDFVNGYAPENGDTFTIYSGALPQQWEVLMASVPPLLPLALLQSQL